MREQPEITKSSTSDPVTEAMNRVVDEVGTDVDEWTRLAGQQVLQRTEW